MEPILISKLALGGLIGVTAIAVFTDLAWHRIPNRLLLAGLVVALFASSVEGGLIGILGAIAGVLVGLAILLPFYALGGMGAGDVKLLAVIGAFLGPGPTVIAGLVTFVAGAVFAGIWIVAQVVRKRLASGGNSLSDQFLLGYIESRDVAQSTMQRKFAYAPAIATGTLVAALHVNGAIA